MAKKKNSKDTNTLSIGDVAKATGISVFTLRMWERRYGVPISQKLQSGHRRYSGDEVARLRLVKLLLDTGQKPSKVAALSISELQVLMTRYSHDGNKIKSGHYIVEQIVDHLKSWDESAILKIFSQEWRALGPVGFLNDRAAKLLTRIGEGWAYGEVSVATEHFASEILTNFLENKWRSKNANLEGKPFLLSCLEGDNHCLGLHFCAVILTTVNKRVLFLGSSTPTDEIIKATENSSCQGVCISISSYYDLKKSKKFLKEISAGVGEEIHLIVGGRGAPKDIEKIIYFDDLKQFYEWMIMEQNNEI